MAGNFKMIWLILLILSFQNCTDRKRSYKTYENISKCKDVEILGCGVADTTVAIFKGRVVKYSYFPVKELKVFLTEGGKIIKQETNLKGEFTFKALDVGNYKLNILDEKDTLLKINEIRFRTGEWLAVKINL